MADSSPKPGQTINPKPSDGEMAIKIDHDNSPKPAPQTVVQSSEQPTEQLTPPRPVQKQPDPSQPPATTNTAEPVAQAEEFPTPQTVSNSEPDEALAEYADAPVNEEFVPEPEGFGFVNDPEEAQVEPVTGEYQWTASEYISHEKTAGWYVALFMVAAVLSGAVYFLTKDKISIFIIFFAAFVFAYFASHKPKEMNYSVTPEGVTVGSKLYHFDEFKSFGLVPEGAFSSIIFMPHKRFAIPITIYYPPESEAKIAELIGNYLPFEEHSKDAIDRLLRAVRF